MEDDEDDEDDEDGKGAAATAAVVAAAAAVTVGDAEKGVEGGFLVLLSPSNSITPSSSSLSELQLPPLGLICTGLLVSRALPFTGGLFALFSRNAAVLDDT